MQKVIILSTPSGRNSVLMAQQLLAALKEKGIQASEASETKATSVVDMYDMVRAGYTQDLDVINGRIHAYLKELELRGFTAEAIESIKVGLRRACRLNVREELAALCPCKEAFKFWADHLTRVLKDETAEAFLADLHEQRMAKHAEMKERCLALSKLAKDTGRKLATVGRAQYLVAPQQFDELMKAASEGEDDVEALVADWGLMDISKSSMGEVLELDALVSRIEAE